MAGVLTGKSWIDFWTKSYHLPAALERIDAAHDISIPLCLSLKSVVGVVTPPSLSNVDYQIAVSLFDTGFKQFFGKQWLGTKMGARGSESVEIHYNQNIYFHTSINSPQILLVMEVVANTIAPDGRPRRVGCGWTLLRPFTSDGKLPDLSRGVAPSTKKAELYHGSPRALYFLDEPVESCQLLKSIPGCQLCYSLASHKAFRKVVPLLPENILVGSETVIPGVELRPGEDHFQQPQIQKAASCALDGVSINLSPSIDVFEEDLCKLLSEDRANRENRPAETLSIHVVERKLQIGVHNGWTYIEKPQVFQVDVFNAQSGGSTLGVDIRKTTASPSIRRSSRFHVRRNSMSSQGSGANHGTSLFLKNQVNLNNLLSDPMFAVVFTLDYVISESLSDKERKITQSLARAHTRTFTVRWAAFNPFLHPSLPEVSVTLTGGVARAPDDEFVYRLPVTTMQDQTSAKMAGGVIAFRFIMGAKDEYLTVPHTSLTVPQLPYSAGSMPSLRSTDGMEDLLDISGDLGRLKPPTGKMPTPRVFNYKKVKTFFYGTPRMMQQQVMQQQQMMLQHQQQQLLLQQGITPSAMGLMQYSQPMSLPYGGPSLGPMGYAAPPVFVDHGPGSVMRDLPFTQVHQPIITQPPTFLGAQRLSRAAYARLYSAGFPPIVDRNGEPPEVLDPALPVSVNLALESADPLQANEIIFQFLAFSRLLPGRSARAASSCVFFTFQFYRYPQVTTERLLLCKPDGQLASDQDNLPFILQKLDRDGSLLKGSPGVEIRYNLDPNFMKPGEVHQFLQHLARQTLHVDVWDGDSLLLVGSCSVPMKYLCRGGHAAVQATFELDVATVEQTDDSAGLTGDLQRGGGVRPLSTHPRSCGKLHLRIANVGHTVDNKNVAEVQPLPSKSQVIVSQTAIGTAHAAPAPQGTKKVRVVRAHHLTDNREVASLLMMHKEHTESLNETEPTRESDAERLRKLARMNAVKTLLQEDNEKAKTFVGYRQEKTERMRDLKTMEIYRQQVKQEGIKTLLSQNITTEHTVFPSFASAEFFEFVLRNPYNQDVLLTIQWNDKALRVVTDAREWRHYKQLCALSTPLEEGMFSAQSTSETPQIFLRPKEMVHIPFKYQSFQADHSVMPQGPSNLLDKQKTSDKTLLLHDDSLKTKNVKVEFVGEDGKAMSILRLQVEPQPHVIDQTFRFHHPENSFLRKSIRLPPFNTLPGAPVGGSAVTQVFTRCSDPNVILDSKPTQLGEPHDIFMKVALGPSPQIKRFYITVFMDPFLSRPIQVWQCYVHALQRLDVNCMEAQTSRISLLLKGTQATRVVRCFSSHPDEMALSPSEAFVLPAGSVTELGVAVRPATSGTKFFFLNVVDMEYHQLVRSWLVCAHCRAPIVSRAFALTLPVGGGKGCNKRITYTNPYPIRKTFKVLTDRPDLLQFKESILQLEGGASQAIGLRFNPVTQPGLSEVLVFINDEEDKNEETFRVTCEHKINVE